MDVYESTTTRLTRRTGSCTLIQDVLPRYLEGEVSPTTRACVASHVMECARCAGFLAGMHQTRAQHRQHQHERSLAVQNDQPARRVLLLGQQVVRLVGLVLVALGIAALVALVVIHLINLWS